MRKAQDPRNHLPEPDSSEPDFSEVPPPAKAEQDVEEAARTAVAKVIARPITDLVMRGASLVESGSENAVAGQVIDQFTELLLLIADPARLPSEIAEKLAAQLATHLVASTLGPVGPVVVIFAGKLVGELTHQVLDGSEGDQDAVRAVEIAGTFADTQIGLLGDSEPFRELISQVVGSSVAAILPGEGQVPATTAVVAVYEVRSPPDDSEVVRIRPASFTVWIPEAAVAKRWKSGGYEYLRLTDGTIIRISPDGTAIRLRFSD